MSITFTAGYIEVFSGDTFLSRHRQEREAVEAILALELDGEYEIRTAPVKVIVKRRIIGPDAPALGPVLTISDTELTVTLDRPANGPTRIDRYEIQRLVGPTWTQIASGLEIFGAGNAYPDTGLLSSTLYNYRCRAVDATERASEYSYASGTTATIDASTLDFDSGFDELPTGPILSTFTSDNWTRVSPDGTGVAEITATRAREGAKSYHTKITRSGTTNYRQELRAKSPTDSYTMPATEDCWIGFSVYVVDNPLTTATAWTVAQWHDSDWGASNQPPLALQLGATGWTLLQRHGLSGAEQSYSTFTDLGAATLNAWNDFVVCVRWDYRESGGNGRVRCWMDDDADGSPRIDVSRAIGYDNAADRLWPWFKVGDYSSLWQFSAPASPDGTIHENYIDAVRIMTTNGSRAAVKPR